MDMWYHASLQIYHGYHTLFVPKVSRIPYLQVNSRPELEKVSTSATASRLQAVFFSNAIEHSGVMDHRSLASVFAVKKHTWIPRMPKIECPLSRISADTQAHADFRQSMTDWQEMYKPSWDTHGYSSLSCLIRNCLLQLVSTNSAELSCGGVWCYI